jgi:hypothetical protein
VKIVWLAVPMLLSACASTGSFQSNYLGSDGRAYGAMYNPGPTSGSDPRLAHMRFYMDDDGATPRWLQMTPQPNR